MTSESEPLPPIVGELYGLLKGQDVDLEDYHRYLEKKFMDEPQGDS